MNSDETRVVVITGCAGGIGLATAVRCANAGDTVVATVRSRERAEELADALAACPGKSEIVELDVTLDSANDVLADVLARHGRIDVLVNNAGLSVEGTLEDSSLEDFQRSMEVNFFGVARVIKAVLPSMREAGSGRIIAISSISGVRGTPFGDAYSSAKFALEGLFECTAPVVFHHGVKMTLVEPGPVAGEFVTKSSALAAEPSAAYKDMYASFDAMRLRAYENCPTPADVAEVIFDVTQQDEPAFRVQDCEASTKSVGGKLLDVDGTRAMAAKALFTPREA